MFFAKGFSYQRSPVCDITRDSVRARVAGMDWANTYLVQKRHAEENVEVVHVEFPDLTVSWTRLVFS